MSDGKGHKFCSFCGERCDNGKGYRPMSLSNIEVALEKCLPARKQHFLDLQRRKTEDPSALIYIHESLCRTHVRRDGAPAAPTESVLASSSTPRTPALPAAATRLSVHQSNFKELAARAAALHDQSLPVYVSKLAATSSRLASGASSSSGPPCFRSLDEVSAFCSEQLTNSGLMPPECKAGTVYFHVHPLGCSDVIGAMAPSAPSLSPISLAADSKSVSSSSSCVNLPSIVFITCSAGTHAIIACLFFY